MAKYIVAPPWCFGTQAHWAELFYYDAKKWTFIGTNLPKQYAYFSIYVKMGIFRDVGNM
jgi:hypothetical protein